MLTTIAAIALRQVSSTAKAPATGDTCEVYLVDVAAAHAAQQAMEKGASEDDLRRLASRAETALGTFPTTVGEEQVTLAVGAAAAKDARDATGNAFAEVPYESQTFKVRVKQYVMLNGRQHLLGVECSSSAARPTH